MHPATIIEVVAAVLGVLGTLTGVIYTTGRREGRVTSALDENARAITKLTNLLDRLDGKYDDHETRITVVETKLKIR